ncbi:MAG: hypothetical protein ACKOXF_10490 [Chitinophagaceae bacterium]
MGVLKSISMLDDQTVVIEFRDDITFDLEGIQSSYRETEAYTGGKKLKRLVLCGRKTDITKEARQYGLKENERLKDSVIAEALVVHSFTQKMITNIYLKYIQKSYPARSFTDIDKAKEWLNTF